MYTPVSDCHVHTDFSPDSKTPAEKAVLKAIELGLRHIAITDHYDPKHPDKFEGIKDAKAYAETIKTIKQKYADRIYVSVGAEIGYTAFTRDMAGGFINNPDVEYIINSVHVVDGFDCYSKKLYKNRDMHEVYDDYLMAVYDSINVTYRYDAIGHIGYVVRRAPYKEPMMWYNEFYAQFNRIFDAIIERGKILEINTSTPKWLYTIPSPELLKAYYDRGGRLITFSSDAHSADRIADGFERAADVARKIGFDAITVKQNGKFRSLPL